MALLTPRWEPLKPHLVQHAYWNSPHRFNLVSAGRRSGKTELAKRKLVKRALRGTEFPDPRFFAAAPTTAQATRIYWGDLKKLVPSDLIARTYEGDHIIRTIMDAEIHVLGMDKPERIEGSPWDGGILDEYGNMKGRAWGENVRPALADRNGWCDLIGVPEGRNHYFKMDERARAEVSLRGDGAEFGSFTWFSSDILPAEEIEAAKRDLHPLVYRQEYEGAFVDFSGAAMFDIEKFLENGAPVAYPTKCDSVFATIDTAVKDGKEHDGTGVTFWATNQHIGHKLIVLDWDIVQIQGALLEEWLPTVFQRLDHLAKICGARKGSIGAWIEDRQSGSVLLQQAANRGWNAMALPETLTGMGKDSRAISVSGYCYRGDVKLSDVAYSKQVSFKSLPANHWREQVFGFRVGQKEGSADDLLDTHTYGVAIALGDSDGY